MSSYGFDFLQSTEAFSSEDDLADSNRYTKIQSARLRAGH
jgi:hypothetical protein